MVEVYKMILPEPAKPDWSLFVGRIVLNKESLTQKRIAVSHVRRAMNVYFGDKVEVITSEDEDDVWIVRLRIAKMAAMTKITTAESTETLHRIATTDMIDMLMDKLVIAGMQSITETYISRENNEYVIDTDGSSLAEIFASGDVFDTRRCSSNTISEIMSTMGVEATQMLLYRECSDVLSDSGEEVSPCHVVLLSKKMCHYGQPMPVTRHGMKRTKQGVLVSASFERTVDTFVEAAVHGKQDACRGVTESIVMNRLPRMGTGFCDMLEAPAPKVAAPPKFVGRRRRAMSAAEATAKTSVFKPHWNFKQSPDQIFRVIVMRERQRAFTPPVEAMTKTQNHFTPIDSDWDMAGGTPEDDDWGAQTPPPSDDDEPMSDHHWSVQLMSPLETEMSCSSIMPWVVRPASPTYT